MIVDLLNDVLILIFALYVIHEILVQLFEQILNFLQPVQPVQPAGDFTNQSTQSTLININTASFEELDTLPGVGKVIGQKIINNRPYSSIEELQTKKIVNKSTYEKIKDLITVD